MSSRDRFLNMDDSSFGSLVDAVDDELAQEGMAITARHMMGWVRFSAKHGLNLMSSEPLAKRVTDHFSAIYGQRLEVEWMRGLVPVRIGHDLYKLKIPLIFGSWPISCDLQTMGLARNTGGPINVLNCIEGLTTTKASKLGLSECRELVLTLVEFHNLFWAINRNELKPRLTDVRAEIDAAIMHLFPPRPHSGLSKWASLQATEKMLKMFLRSKGVAYKFSHDLMYLLELAENCGLPSISRTNVALIQTVGAARYGEITVSQSEAMAAYYASVRVCGLIAEAC